MILKRWPERWKSSMEESSNISVPSPRFDKNNINFTSFGLSFKKSFIFSVSCHFLFNCWNKDMAIQSSNFSNTLLGRNCQHAAAYAVNRLAAVDHGNMAKVKIVACLSHPLACVVFEHLSRFLSRACFILYIPLHPCIFGELAVVCHIFRTYFLVFVCLFKGTTSTRINDDEHIAATWRSCYYNRRQ